MQQHLTSIFKTEILTYFLVQKLTNSTANIVKQNITTTTLINNIFHLI